MENAAIAERAPHEILEELGPKGIKLSSKERKFVDTYVLTNSPYEAGKSAGFSDRTVYSRAYKLLRDERIKNAIELKKAELALRYSITQDYFIIKLKTIIEDKFSKTTEKIAALQLLARITGHIKERPPEAKQLVILRQEGLSEKAIEVDVAEFS